MSCCSCTVPGLVGAMLTIRSRRGTGGCTARWSPVGIVCSLAPVSCQLWRHDPSTTAQLCNASAAEQPQHHAPPWPVSSASSLAPLPPGALPESPCFSQANLKSSNPTKYGKVFLSPLLSKASALPLTFPLQTRSCVPHKHCRDGGWRHPRPRFLRQTQC